jgi:hypothetical protein
MPLQATSGAASYDAFGGGTVAKVNYIEDFFQSYLRTGTGASATVTTGLDGSTKETLVWTKSRSAATNHKLTDNVRGATKALSSNTTSAEATDSQGLTAFSATGYTIGTNTDYNNSGATYVDWQWVSQPKFFDVVTWTGNDTARTIAHNLGSVPGCIIVKATSSTANWYVYHRSTGNQGVTLLNTTNSVFTGQADAWNSTTPTATEFSVGNAVAVNSGGVTYVAYLFAHDAGGFGLTGTDNVISCGSYTGNGTIQTVSLGYEPQWVLVKNISSGARGFGSSWAIQDNMRGFPSGGAAQTLYADRSDSEDTNTVNPNATGFSVSSYNVNGDTYIYIAIRRGPMKVPTVGTSVFSPDLYTGNGTTQSITSGSPPLDLVWIKGRTGSQNPRVYDRLRGATISLIPEFDFAESTRTGGLTAFTQNGFSVGANGNENDSGVSIIAWDFKRAPSFMDVVCYTGTGATNAVNHNLAAPAEMIIVKGRNYTVGWTVGANLQATHITLGLNTNSAQNNPASNQFYFGNGTVTVNPTSTQFTVRTADINQNGNTYVAYLFATCAGVSKVGSYTGTATTLQIDCGFTSGARFVLIKRTDSTGDWYVWDSARGIVAGNDPYLLLNTSTNEVTSTDYIDTYSAGFEISSTAPAEINASGGTFIFLAIA